MEKGAVKAMKRIFLLSVFLTGAFVINSPAQENGAPLTLQKCFEFAKTQSDSLKAQYEQQVQARQRLVQAKGGLLPQVNYYLNKTERDNGGGLYDGESTDSRFTVTQPLFSGFSRKANIDSSKIAVEASALLYKSAYQNIKASVVSAFYTLLLNEIDLANVSTSQKALEDRVKELNERVRLGKSRDSEVLVLQSQIATLLAQEEQIEGDRIKALEQLSYLIGVDSIDLKVVDGMSETEDVAPLDKFLGDALRRPDIEAARKEVEFQRYRIKVVKGQLFPTLDFTGSLYTLRSSMPDSNWEALLALDVPLFQGGIARGMEAEQISKWRASQDQLSQLNKDIRTAINQLYRTLESSIKQMAAYKDAYEKAEKSYQIQIRDYRYGLVNNLDVIQSISTLLDVKRNFDRSIIQVKVNKILLKIATEN